MKKYIHYGNTVFDKSKFKKVENQGAWSKPTGGFWASPVDAALGWYEWCKSEEPDWCDDNVCFTFGISESANVIHIKKVEDLDNLPSLGKCLVHGIASLDFEKMCADGIDAIELHLSDDERLDRNLNFALYGWDCDSILIMNPEIVITEDSNG